MDSLDIVSNSNVLLVKNRLTFKNKIGGIFTLIQYLVSAIVIIFLSLRKHNNVVNSFPYYSSSFKNLHISWLIKFPKKYNKYIYKIKFSNKKYSNIQECEDIEYFNFYNTTKKED